MEKGYLAEKEDKKRATMRAIWILIVFLVLFIIVLLRIAFRTGSKEGIFAAMPSGNNAYEIAKTFVKPTIKSANYKFAGDDAFKYTMRSDSVYVIRSYFETKAADSSKAKKNFVITVKYNGGSFLNQQNWTELDLEDK